ncbi:MULTISPECIES: hypothetical protein [unclassified Streptomyces]|uniref:hypothetical protein n=1 Tax=unclassified Streptomyces TaxID=2593676 RepID=UPI00344D63F8
MTVHDLLIAPVVLTILRVFAPDARALTRRLLTAGVRIGTTEILNQAAHSASAAAPPAAAHRAEPQNPSASSMTVLPPASRRGKG